MLRELRIRDIAIIEDVAVEFGGGFNVLSGETGAGKSIVLGALGLVLGGRAGAEWVRTGRPSAEVQARFDRTPEVDAALAELDVEPGSDEDGLLLRRIVTSAGRSRAYIGAAAVPLAALRRVAVELVDYAGQHEHQVLLDEARHLGILDRFGVDPEVRDAAARAVATTRGLVEEQRLLDRQDADRRAREGYVRHQVEEFDDADLQPDEDQALEAERAVLCNAVALADRARRAEAALYGDSGSAVERIGDACGRLRELVAVDPGMSPVLDAVEESLYAVEEAGRELAAYARRTQQDPVRLEELEDRLAVIHDLQRKHRRDFEGLLELHRAMRAELDDLENLTGRRDELSRALESARAIARTECAALATQRAEAGILLAREVEEQLAGLAMARARLVATPTPVPEEALDAVGLGPDGSAPFALSAGTEQVRFLLSANPGEEPRRLSRVASGGELSRILLSVRRALAGASATQVQVCIFDEVDTGLGGATAEKVGDKLQEIAVGSQVLCITHLPQIAARADQHYRVEKEVSDGRTRTLITKLDAEERVRELVRMVAGAGVGGTAEAFAREMLARSGAFVPG
jgi:DNA repair protein RecN (Recombination protein N)